jgi:RecA-family ATPase
MGNIAASNEVGYYEMIAVATQATVILLHHTTKKSRDGSLDGMQAYRDATAWFDDTRASWYFRSATEKELSIEGVDLKDKQDYFIFENSKNSYIKKQNIKIVQRRGYSFFFRDAISLENKKEAGDKKGQELLEEMVAWMQAERETVFCQADMIRWGKNFLNVGRSKILTTLNNGCEDGLIELTGGKVGQMKKYSLTEYGLCYNLQVG